MARRTGGQACDEPGKVRAQCGKGEAVGGGIGDHAVAPEQERADFLQRGLDGIPVAIDLGQEVLQEEVVGNAAELLVEPVGLAEAGADAQ